WIRHCRANHGGYCKGQLSAIAFTIPGFRLIDCQTRQVSKHTEEVEYVALSYVWGNGSHASTRALPNPAQRVIEDAMIATKELGFRYLWVDRYCISQLDTSESRTQIANMDRIYAGAVFTIAAAAGEGPNYGLPGVSHRQRHVQPRARFEKLHLVASPPPPRDVIRASKWASRGWTFQESKLSRRTLFFTDDQVIFECGSMTCEE
ncbi:HET-domain-containing protein, partial [Westerdykella ornata]